MLTKQQTNITETKCCCKSEQPQECAQICIASPGEHQYSTKVLGSPGSVVV